MKRYIRKVQMDCPVCGKTHMVEERSRIARTEIKDVIVDYEERFYFCANADEDENEFATGEMIDENLLNARNEYRIKNGLLTSNEIVAIRKAYALSQVDLARLLGWGEATISRYESKAIQDEAYDAMIRLIKDNPLHALECLKKNSDTFSERKYQEIRGKMIEKLDSYGKEYLSRQALESEYVNFEEPEDSNGYTVLNIDKIEAVVSYFANNVKELYKIKLMKMLWYADALSFKKCGRAITGLVYRHEYLGALPVGHYSLMNLENISVKEEMNRSYETMLHVYPMENIDYSVLTAYEKKILDKVIDKFSGYKTKQIIDYMHDEKAYLETKQGDIIPFSLASEIKKF